MRNADVRTRFDRDGKIVATGAKAGKVNEGLDRTSIERADCLLGAAHADGDRRWLD